MRTFKESQFTTKYQSIDYQIENSCKIMKAQTSLLHSEPQTHTSSCHWRQWLLCEDYRLNSDQLHVFFDLKQQANIIFEGKDQRWDLVKNLYLQYFGEPVKTSGKEFLKLGFQGHHPQTDFRGGGVLSLQLILRFVKNNRQLVQQMENDKGNFFFAITAINICFFMKNYFHLSNSLTPIRDKELYCDRRALKNMCRVMAADQQAFMKMHEVFLEWFYKQKWLQAAERHPETLLQFNDLFAGFKTKVRNVFEEHKMDDWNDFLALWNSP